MTATAENVPAKETSEISASIQEEEGKSNVAAASAPTAAAAVPSDKDTPFDEQDEGKEEAEGEEEETCGFCIFMKGGGCKEAFQSWSKCVDRERDAGNDFTEECREATIRLRECMLEHREYYAPLLEEEEAEIEAARKAAEAAGGTDTANAPKEEEEPRKQLDE